MSYIDNELNAAERAAVEAFVLTEPKYAATMAVFEKAKLHAPTNDFIEMEDKIFLYRFPEMQASLDPDFKKSLYRKEAPVRKIIFTPNLMRASFAIAAMLILLIGLQLFKSDFPLLESNIVESNIIESPLKAKTTVASTNILIPTENKTLANAAIATKAITKNRTENKNETQNQNQNENQTIIVSANYTSNSINTNIVSSSSSQASRKNDSQNIVAAKFNEGQISSSSMETMATEEEKTILPTNYKEIDTEEEDRTINIGMLEIDAAAFRGITRKFSALLKRNKIEK
ncbi:MAG: hypothetical protein HQ449_08560 [Chitinophagaceae bacterium]|nr:hypothetical protein [Chitinophagaceae bacterium]